MHTQINVFMDKKYGPSRNEILRSSFSPLLNTNKRTFTLKRLPTTHNILAMNTVVANETIKIGMVKFHEVNQYHVKQLIRDRHIACPFILFVPVATDPYNYKWTLQDKIIYDLRNVPRYSFVLNAIDENPIHVK